MSIKGKVLGSIIGGLFSTNVWGAALGGIIGHFLLDSSEDVLVDDVTIDSEHADCQFINPLHSLIRLGIYLISLQRVVTVRDTMLIRMSLIHFFNFDNKDSAFLDRMITGNLLKFDSIDSDSTLKSINRYFKYEEKLSVIHLLLQISYTDGKPDEQVIQFLTTVQQQLEIYYQDFIRLKTEYQPESEEWFTLLGVCEGASVREIKLAYRNQISKLHPDKSGSDTPEDRERFQKIMNAYNSIKKIRNIR